MKIAKKNSQAAIDIHSPVRDLRIKRHQKGRLLTQNDIIVVEEPLEIRLNQESITVTMRSPGHDHELAAGLLFSESLLRSADDIGSIAYCNHADAGDKKNIVNVMTTHAVDLKKEKWRRNFFSSSSCGLCGKTTLDSVRQNVQPLPEGLLLPPDFVQRALIEMRQKQLVFAKTGGLHSAALYHRERGILAVREDIGRHNAVDKVIGHALINELNPLHQYALMVSGRISFEIAQKALIAGIPVLVAVSAASTLAVDLALENNMTLIGFCRDDSFNVYCGWQRIG